MEYKKCPNGHYYQGDVCPQCGYGQQSAPPQYNPQPAQQPYGRHPDRQKPDNNLVWAILSTVMCCWPLGLVAILSANKVDTLWAEGRYAEAEEAAAKAKKWSMWSAFSIVVLFGLYVVFLLVAMLAAMASEL